MPPQLLAGYWSLPSVLLALGLVSGVAPERVHLLPILAIFLLGLLSVYWLTERLWGPVCALLAVVLGLKLDLFAFGPLISGPTHVHVACLTLAALQVALGSRPLDSARMPFLAGLLTAGCLLTHWSGLAALALVLAVLALRAWSTHRSSRRAWARAILSFAAWVAPVAAVVAYKAS